MCTFEDMDGLRNVFVNRVGLPGLLYSLGPKLVEENGGLDHFLGDDVHFLHQFVILLTNGVDDFDSAFPAGSEPWLPSDRELVNQCLGVLLADIEQDFLDQFLYFLIGNIETSNQLRNHIDPHRNIQCFEAGADFFSDAVIVPKLKEQREQPQTVLEDMPNVKCNGAQKAPSGFHCVLLFPLQVAHALHYLVADIGEFIPTLVSGWVAPDALLKQLLDPLHFAHAQLLRQLLQPNATLGVDPALLDSLFNQLHSIQTLSFYPLFHFLLILARLYLALDLKHADLNWHFQPQFHELPP